MSIDVLSLSMSYAKQNDSEKVGFSMTIPKHLKDDFSVYCRKNGVTMTALLLGFMSACLSVDSSSSEPQNENHL